MADPFTIITAVAGGAKVLGGISDTVTRVGQYKADARIEDGNARLLDSRAQQAGAEAARSEEAARREYRQLAGGQLAAAGESNLGAGGSLADIIRQSEVRAELDAQNIRYRGATEARGFRMEAANARTRSSLATQMAKRARLGGIINTVGNLATGGANTYAAANRVP